MRFCMLLVALLCIGADIAFDAIFEGAPTADGD